MVPLLLDDVTSSDPLWRARTACVEPVRRSLIDVNKGCFIPLYKSSEVSREVNGVDSIRKTAVFVRF